MTKNKFYWYLIATLSLLIFALIATLLVLDENMLKAIDNPIIHLLRGSITSGKTLFFSTVTKLGNTSTIIILTALISGLLYYYKEKVAALWIAINIILIQGVGNSLLKLIFNRERPSHEHLVYAGGKSFPSGHSMGSMLLYGSIILLLPKFIKNKTLCSICQALLGLVILLVGTSRIYVGVHYPTDVIAGFSIGLCWLSFSYPHFKKYDSITH